MMKGKKHASHPKSFPTPATAVPASRNQNMGGIIKAGTIQVKPKMQGRIVRNTKSPPASLSKALTEYSAHGSPKLGPSIKPGMGSKQKPPSKVAKPEESKSLKKSVSNGDMKSVSKAVETYRRQPIQNATNTKSMPMKRHSPSPAAKSTSPTRATTAKPVSKNPCAQPSEEFKGEVRPGIKAPWSDFMERRKEYESKLRDAAEEGRLEECKRLLNKSTMRDYLPDINARNYDGWSALHLAVNEGHSALAGVLINLGGDIELRTKQLKTPLHIACCRGDINAVKLLLSHKADLTAQDLEGNTCLHTVSMYGMSKLMEFISANYNISLYKQIKNKEGKSVVDVAANSEILRTFGVVKSDSGKPRQKATKQVHVYHTDPGTVSKFMGNMIQKPAGDDADEDLEIDSIIGSRAEEAVAEPIKPVNIVRGPIPGHFAEDRKYKGKGTPPPSAKPGAAHKVAHKATHTEAPSSNEMNSELTESDEKVGPHSFVVQEVLGKGSFGEVYLVEKVDTHKLYAMKVLSKRQIMSQNLVKYALTERDVLSVTNHPFIVKLNFAFQTNHKLFLLLDYCPGCDLSAYIEKEKRFTEDRARIYLAEILLAIQDLHKRDIIYRDLKPDNVVLDEDGHALLTDFGLSKQGLMDNDTTRSFCGSIAYLAPEMIKKSGHGKALDWYLFGVLMYEMLVGQPPYFDKDRDKLLTNIQKGVLKIPARMSEEAKSLIVALLNRNPTKRLGSGPTDAEEIKRHPFFRGMVWEEVYTRKLCPPKPTIKKESFALRMSPQMLQSSTGSVSPENRIVGWSFAARIKASD